MLGCKHLVILARVYVLCVAGSAASVKVLKELSTVAAAGPRRPSQAEAEQSVRAEGGRDVAAVMVTAEGGASVPSGGDVMTVPGPTGGESLCQSRRDERPVPVTVGGRGEPCAG